MIFWSKLKIVFNIEYHCDLFEYFISLVFPFSFQIDGEAQAVNKPSFFKLHPLNKSTFLPTPKFTCTNKSIYNYWNRARGKTMVRGSLKDFFFLNKVTSLFLKQPRLHRFTAILFLKYLFAKPTAFPRQAAQSVYSGSSYHPGGKVMEEKC